MRFLDRLRLHSAVRPDQPAIQDETRCITYKELLGIVTKTSGRLYQLGIDCESVVGIAIADEVDHFSITLALMALGASQVVLATHDSLTVRRTLAARARVSHVLAVNDDFIVDGTKLIDLSCRKSASGVTPASLSDATIYLKTSGTSGDMNIVPLGESQIGIQASRLADGTVQRLLRLASIEHNNSKRHRLYCTWNGGTNIFRPRVSFDTVEFCLEFGVSCLDISRVHAADLIARADSGNLAGLRIRTGGSDIPFEIRQALMNKVSPDVHVRYAANECGPIANAGPDDHDIDESAGHLFPGMDLEIVGPDGSAPPGELGEIRLRAAGMATSYLDRPDITETRFRADWFYPGDMGVIRNDGQIVVTGRKDDIIILNGLNISPMEIERVLERHPAVVTAAALPITSRVHGQIPVAAVELYPGAAVTPAELQRYAREHLALRAPRRIIVMSDLPRNPEGKVVKHEIASAFNPDAATNG